MNGGRGSAVRRQGVSLPFYTPGKGSSMRCGVSFDVWGTLLDLHRAYAAIAERLSPILGLPPEDALEALRLAAREARADRRRKGWHDARRGAEIVAARLGVKPETLEEVVEEALLDAAAALPLPGAREAVEGVRSLGLPAAILGNVLFWPGSLTRELLQATGLANLFDAVLFADEIGCSKPSPCAFEKAAEALGVEVDKLIHVGDRVDEDVGGVVLAGGSAILAWSRLIDRDALCVHNRLCAVREVRHVPRAVELIISRNRVNL